MIGFSCVSLQTGEIPFHMSFMLIVLLLYQPGRKIKDSGFLLSFATHSADEILPGWSISAQTSWNCKSHRRHCVDVCRKEYQLLPHSAELLWVLVKGTSPEKLYSRMKCFKKRCKNEENSIYCHLFKHYDPLSTEAWDQKGSYSPVPSVRSYLSLWQKQAPDTHSDQSIL